MSRVNIPSTILDPSYRYTMPKMVLKQESRLNGVKTNITNLNDVANALRVPPNAIIKYFCAEVGANQEQDTIVKGSHTPDSFAKLLDKFILKYVLCGKCKYPECAFEVQKKEVLAICNACGYQKKLDNQHKAGKQLVKDVPTFYSANPEFRGKTGKATQDLGKMAEQNKAMIQKSNNKAQTEDQKEEAKIRAEQLMKQGGEINVLDAKPIEIDSDEMNNLITQIDTYVSESERSIDDLLTEVRQMQLIMNITSEYKYYILFCGLFQGKRNCVTTWPKYESAFLKLIKNDGEVGIKRLMQTIVLYFIKRDPAQQKYLNSFMKALYDQSVFSDQFVIGWYNNTIKSDKKCALYDRKSEKVFRPLIQTFVDWLQSAEYDEEAEYGAEETGDNEIEVKVEESDAAKAQRLMVEAQKKAQIAAAADSKQRAKQEEEANEVALVEKVDVTKINVAEEFDIDDI